MSRGVGLIYMCVYHWNNQLLGCQEKATEQTLADNRYILTIGLSAG